jgi:hypothetical protein
LPNTTKEVKDREDREVVQHRDRREQIEKFRSFVMGFLVFNIQNDYAVFGLFKKLLYLHLRLMETILLPKTNKYTWLLMIQAPGSYPTVWEA